LKKLIFITCCLFGACALFGQADTSLKLVTILKGEYLDFTVDNLGNIFLLDKNNQLKKLTSSGDSVAVFNDVRRYGNVYSIDATNPLKVLLYYKEFATIVVLDRLLNVRTTIDLRQQNIFQARAICQSYDNNIWVYDEGSATLKKVGDDGTIVDQTGDLRLQLDDAPAPESLADQDRLVYMYDSIKGLFIFDYFGTLKNKLAFTGWEDFQVVGKYIVGRKGILLERYQLSSLLLQERTLPAVLKNVTKARIAIDRLYCLRDGFLYIYSL